MSEDQNRVSQEAGKTDSQKEEVNENITQQQAIEPTQPQVEQSEIPIATGPEIINQASDIPKSDIANMEVHYHPKVDSHLHGKRNLKEYLLEGLMIFIAVTLGFFAGNIRENITDKKQEHEYVHSMISDLKSDVAMYKTNNSLNLGYCDMIDTIMNLLNKKSNMGEVYYLARKLTIAGYSFPSINAKTYAQMTSTGSFRLIKNQHVADSIATYYQLIKSFDNWSDFQRIRVNNLIAANDKIFSADVFFSLYKAIEANDSSLQQIIQSNPPLISDDPLNINAAMMHCQYYYGFLKLMISRCLMASERAQAMIELLKKEYNMKDE